MTAQTAVKLFFIKIFIRLSNRHDLSDPKMPNPEVKATMTPSARAPACMKFNVLGKDSE